MSTFFQDIRFAIRSLRKSPGFTLAAVVTLALGIGANAAVYSLVRSVLLRPLPFPAPERLVAVAESNPSRGWKRFAASPPNFVDFQSSSRSFAAMGAYTTQPVTLTGRGEPEQLNGTVVTGGFFPALAEAPELGRLLGEADAAYGAARTVVLSHRVWMRRFGGDPAVVGTSIRLDGEPVTVLGVMPPDFRFPEEGADLWMPLSFAPDVFTTQRGAHYLDIVGRLRTGTSLEAARAELRAIADRLRLAYPRTNAGYSAAVTPLDERLVGSVRPALLLLLGAVTLVTLIACANVANLLLIRASRRGAEMAIRGALGAGRGRLARQLLTESLVLAAFGAAAGFGLAATSLDLVVRLAPASVPRLAEVRIDAGVLLFTLAWTLAAAVVAGLAPAVAVSRSSPIRFLRAAGVDAASGRSGALLRRILVAAQVAVALVLLAGAGLLVRSLVRLTSVDPGFRTRSVLVYDLTLPESRYPDEARQAEFTELLLARMRALPGVESAAAVLGLPLTGFSFSSSLRIGGVEEDNAPSVQLRVASPDYFQSLGIPLLSGRLFGAEDRYGAPHAVLVSASAARKLWPAGDALGKHVRLGARPGQTRIEGEVVGVVGDVRDDELGVAPVPELYASMAQAPVSSFHVALRTAGHPSGLSKAVRETVERLDPDLVVNGLGSFEDVVSSSVGRPRFAVRLLLLFSGLALLLSAVGIYGVVAYAVSQRTREIGIRMALGADRASVRGLVLRDGLRLTLAGLALGLAGAFGATRLMRGLLFEVSPGDLATHLGVSVLLLGVALAATGIPAWRASRVEPVSALRGD